MKDFTKLTNFLLSNDFEPSQIDNMAYSKGCINVDVLEKTRVIERIASNQGELIEREPALETYYIGKIYIENPELKEEGKSCLYFNPDNLNDFLLKFSVIHDDLKADFKFVKSLDDMPKISITTKFTNDNSLIKYFLSNLYA